MIDPGSYASEHFLSPLYKELLKRRAARAEELARIADVFDEPKVVARYYVEPSCQHHNPANRDEGKAPMAQIRQPAFKFIDAFLKGDYPPLRDGRSHLFILADAGMGKSLLLVMIRLMHLMAFWPRNYNCLLLKLGPETAKIVCDHEHHAHSILLLDALDEDPDAWGRMNQRLVEILDATKRFRRVIITCRTQFFPETGADVLGRPGYVTVGGYTCPLAFLSLFDDDQVHTYLSKRFPDGWMQRLLGKQNQKRLRAAQVVRSMESLRFRPLLLAHIEDIMDGDQQKWNVYTLYETLVDRWLDREERKLREMKIRGAPTKEMLWRICAVVASHMQVSGSRLLPREELDALVARFREVAAIKHFNVGGRSLMNRNAEGAYRFSHYSIQEFLVVHDLVHARRDSGGRTVRVTADMLGFLEAAGVMPPGMRLDLSGLKPKALSRFGFRDDLSDGSHGPLMNLIASGDFMMGSAESDMDGNTDEKRLHKVNIRRPFALGRFPVTFDEYDRFCKASVRQKPGAESWGRGSRPVINVSWDAAIAYCAWLSRQTGQTYRLPTEAEWEYACRGGSDTLWSFGDDESGAGLAEHAWFCANASAKTQPVGQRQPNRYGLYDMHGNLWEWVQDCWHADGYARAPTDGAAWQWADGGDCDCHVLRGGCWNSTRRELRSASRSKQTAYQEAKDVGFRVARDL